MAGAFATWQPIYDEAGIATFPLNAVTKVPAVGNYDKAGRPASRQWAKKFQDSEAFGFLCGKRSKLSILDIDTPSENFLADSLKRFGPSPIIARTPSGGFHAWYRYNGEARKIRPEKGSPFDILGGGVAIAPPSDAGKGRYEFIQGSLADLASLLPMRSAPAEIPLETAQDDFSGALASEGKRNYTLWREAMSVARGVPEFETLLRIVQNTNRNAISPPLPSDEVMRLCKSAWDKEQSGDNMIGSGRQVRNSFDVIDAFIPKDGPPHKTAPDGLMLFTFLQRVHYGRDTFVVANALHERMGWPLRRFVAARRYLESMGRLRMIKPPSRTTPAIYGF